MHQRIDYFSHPYWLLYPVLTESIVLHFGEARVADTRLVVGYNTWQCHSKILKHHETSGYNINAYLMWKELASRLCLGKTIDSELQRACWLEWSTAYSSLQKETCHWGGQNGNPRNGNILGILDLIARYDVTLTEHLRKAASKKKHWISVLVHSKWFCWFNIRVCFRSNLCPDQRGGGGACYVSAYPPESRQLRPCVK